MKRIGEYHSNPAFNDWELDEEEYAELLKILDRPLPKDAVQARDLPEISAEKLIERLNKIKEKSDG